MSLGLIVEEAVDPAAWDAAALELNGTPFHCHAWGGYRARLSGATPLYLAWRSAEGRSTAVAVGWERRPAPGIRVVELDAVPAQRPDESRDLADSIVAWARSRGAVELRIGSAGFADVNPPYEGNGAARVEFLVAPGDSESLAQRMPERARLYLAATGRQGVEAAGGDSDDVPAFVALHGETLARLNWDRGLGLAFRGQPLTNALRFLVERDRARVYLARHERHPVAGALFACFGRSAYYLLSGSNDTGRRTRAAAYLINFALADLSEAGFTTLNLGGSPSAAASADSPDHGLYRFKTSFGALPKACPPEREFTLRPVRAAAFQLARRLLRR